MEFSEEERLKELSKYELFLDNIVIKDKTARQILVSAYNKLKRQQKEIEELKKPKYLAHFENNKITKIELINDFISKDKIKDIIERYEQELEHIKNGEEFENEKPMYYWGKAALQELLEEN